jgi:hypothetical protein
MFHRKIAPGTIAMLAGTAVAQYRDRAAIVMPLWPDREGHAPHVDSRNG